MNELLKKLFEAEILTADTKQQIEEAFATQMQDLIAETKAATETEVRTELSEKWLETRDQLIEALDLKVTEMVAEEFKELGVEWDSFRDLEVEYAGKLTEAKAEMVESYKKDVSQLTEHLDAFLAIAIKDEVQELKADLEEAKKDDFGRRLFEAFANEYATKFINESEVHTQLEAAQTELTAIQAKLSEATASKLKLERSVKMESVLAPLAGGQRELMETILSGVKTEDLDKAYEKYISRVLKESKQPEEKEGKVLAEGAEDKDKQPGVVKTGDTPLEESQSKEEPQKPVLTEAQKAHLQRLAGIRA